MGFLTFLHAFIAVILVIAILMQAGKGGGLAEGFSSAENLMGAQTNKFMTKVTAVLAALYFALAIVLAIMNAQKEHSLMDELPDSRSKATMNIDQLFDQPASQTITINAEAAADEATLPTATP